MGYQDRTSVSELLGKTLTQINVNEHKDEITFITSDGDKYRMLHDQDCCESVAVDDIDGDLADLIGAPLTQAEEAVSENENPEGLVKDYQDSFTWTFYKFATVKGYVTIRWYGESNGYYSESVEFEKVND